MKEYIITYNYGYGDEIEIIEAENESEALDLAEQAWREGAEMQSDYAVIGEATDELKDEHGL